MFKGLNVAIIGEAGLCFAWKALGLKVFSAGSLDEARAALKIIEKEDYAVCFIHESYFGPLKEERTEAEGKFLPVIVGFSDYRKVPDHLEAWLKGMAVRATGSDFLLKRKGEYETR